MYTITLIHELVMIYSQACDMQKYEKEVAAENAWRQQHGKEQRKRRYIIEGQAAQRSAKRVRAPAMDQ